MRKNKQLDFTETGFEKPSDCFGGSLLTSNPKTKRPLDSKWPTHVVLRARESTLRTPKNFARVNKLVHELARKYGLRIYEYANVGNHIHLVVRLGKRSSWMGFVRELTGRVARFARSGASGRFWKHRPYTRIVRSWRKAFQAVRDYVEFNRLEADGHIKRDEIKSLKELRILFASS